MGQVGLSQGLRFQRLMGMGLKQRTTSSRIADAQPWNRTLAGVCDFLPFDFEIKHNVLTGDNP